MEKKENFKDKIKLKEIEVNLVKRNLDRPAHEIKKLLRKYDESISNEDVENLIIEVDKMRRIENKSISGKVQKER